MKQFKESLALLIIFWLIYEMRVELALFIPIATIIFLIYWAGATLIESDKSK